MTRVRRTALAAGLALAVGALGAPAPAAAEDAVIRSFDGTPIVIHFFPAEGLRPGERAPTVLYGPGWSSGGDTNPESETSEGTGGVGTGPLRQAGYNVLTFDPRGFGRSGDAARVDSKDFEGRDVQAMLDWLAARPEVMLDRRGDPRAGMTGVSYGGGIQNVTAAIDRRIDAIVPAIAWHSLISSLYKAGDVKAGWGLVLCGLGEARGLTEGLIGPDGLQTGSVDEHVRRACVQGTTTGTVSEEDKQWFADRGPGDELMSRIRVPTLIVQGTVDTLFTLQEAIENHRVLKRTGVPLKMMWFCGGHGACQTGSGTRGHVERRTIQWLDRYLKRDRSIDTGPRFEWLADDAVWRSGAGWPLPQTGALRGSGSGVLPLSPAAQSGALVLATPVAAGAFDVPIEAATRELDVLGAPRLTLRYSGDGTPQRGWVYAQIVDERRGVVVDNQVTPVPIVLDGAEHTVELPLEPIAVRAAAGSRYRLQLVPSTNLYYPQRIAGALRIERAAVSLPIVDPTARAGAPRVSISGLGGRCRSSATVRVRARAPIESVEVRVDGRLVRRTRRSSFRVKFTSARGARLHRLTVTAEDRRGARRTASRRFRACTAVNFTG